MSLPVYSIVIPTYGQVGLELLRYLFPTLNYTCRLEHEVIIVDDGSPELVAQALEPMCQSNGAMMLHSKENAGFSMACNAGISAASGHVIILMNNDVIPIGDALDHMADFVKFSGVGVVGCKLLYPDNRIQHAGIYYVDPSAVQGVNPPPPHGWFDHVGRFMDRHSVEACRITPRLVTGALMAISGNLLNSIGLLDTRFGMACEDVDLCLRTFEVGSVVVYNGRIEAYHLEGTTRGNTLQAKAQHPEWTAAEERGMTALFEKWEGLDFKQFSIQPMVRGEE